MNHLEVAREWTYRIGEVPLQEEKRCMEFSKIHALIAIAEQLEIMNKPKIADRCDDGSFIIREDK